MKQSVMRMKTKLWCVALTVFSAHVAAADEAPGTRSVTTSEDTVLIYNQFERILPYRIKEKVSCNLYLSNSDTPHLVKDELQVAVTRGEKTASIDYNKDHILIQTDDGDDAHYLMLDARQRSSIRYGRKAIPKQIICNFFQQTCATEIPSLNNAGIWDLVQSAGQECLAHAQMLRAANYTPTRNLSSVQHANMPLPPFARYDR